MASILSPNMTHEDNDPERSDPSVNSDTLPDDHPIHFLLEARKYYGNIGTPPFVINKRAQVIKVVVIPTKDGLRPKDSKATKAKIVAKVCALHGGHFSSRCIT